MAPSLSPALVDDPLRVRVGRLDNGLTVYLSENHQQPRIYARTVVRAGAAQDPRDATGTAHILEHLLANKGSERLGARDIEREKPIIRELESLHEQVRQSDDEAAHALRVQIASVTARAASLAVPNELKQAYGHLGARRLNAFTSHDQTSYVVDVPGERLAAWAALEGDRFTAPVFRAFATELDTIREEKHRALDNASRAIRDGLESALWKAHPYGTTVLGEVPHLLRPSMRAAREFFEAWYVAPNMAVVLAGDLDADEAFAAVVGAFSDLPSRLPPERSTAPPEPPTGEERVELVHHGQLEVRIAWPAVPSRHPDEPALTLVDLLLANRATGLIDRLLVQPQRLRSAGALRSFRRDAGSLVAWGRALDGQTAAEVEALLLEVVERLRLGEVDEETLAAILRNYEVDELEELEGNRARANAMARAFVREESWARSRQRLQKLREVSRDDLVRVARTYLGAARVVAVRRPGNPERRVAPVLPREALAAAGPGHSTFFEEVLAKPAPEPRVEQLVEGVDFERDQTPVGLRYRTPNPYSNLFQLTLRWQTGIEDERRLAAALQLWERSGCGELDRGGVEGLLYRGAVDTAIGAGRHATDLTLRGPPESLADVIPLLHERLVAPVLPIEERRSFVADLLARRVIQRETREFRIVALGAWALRAERSLFLEGRAPPEELEALVTEEPGRWTRGLLRLPRTSVYTGPHGASELDDLLVAPPLGAARPAHDPVQYFQAEQDRLLLVHHDSVQCHLAFYVPDGPYGHEEAALRRLWREVFSGSAGLIFQQIREARGIAYAARAAYTVGERVGDDNLAWGSVECGPDRLLEAARLLVSLLREAPVTEDRFERARTAAAQKLATHRVGFRSMGWAAEGWRLRGWEGDPRARILAALQRVELPDFLAFARRAAERPGTLAVVGDLTRIDRAGLEGLVPVAEELTVDQLTV